jgi:hypothetical protein
MPVRRTEPARLSKQEARRIWLAAQRLDTRAPFGSGPQATRQAVEHLGYVQIDTINVIERCHHHILFTRIPAYRRADLAQAQSTDRSVFEYWTHALAYVPVRDLRFYLRAMKHDWDDDQWFGSVTRTDLNRIVRRIRDHGALSIRDIDDDDLVEKDHPWASRKPSRKALQKAFLKGLLTISGRDGMVKTYELMDRHFGWDARPKPASETEILVYRLDRAVRAQGIVSLDSICHLDARRKPAIRKLIEQRVRKGDLVAVALDEAGKVEHWAAPARLDTKADGGDLVHLLSPFDPLVIQRKRLSLLFGYEHRFEAYVPKDKRVLGYFALPVLVGDEIVAAIDLKTDRAGGTLMIRQWTWVGRGSPAHRAAIEDELGRFEAFQLAR